MKRPAPPELLEFLEPFPDDVSEIVLALRGRVLMAMANAHETVWDATNAVSLAYSPSTRWQDGIVHIATYAKHANLGFNDGASLDDPARVLSGTGARIRHVTCRSLDDVGAPWVDDYLRAALAHAGLDASMGDGGTTVRVSRGPKRRPQ
jgi:hypothetical protein